MTCCDSDGMVLSKEQLIKALMAENPSLDYGAVEVCVKTWLENPDLVDRFAAGEVDYAEVEGALSPTVDGTVEVE